MSTPRLFRTATSTPAARTSRAKRWMTSAGVGGEAARAARVQRDEVDERPAVAREPCERPRVLGAVVDAAEHHVLERGPPVERLRGVDHVGRAGT
jgi:hypothetical protein